jgi:hypothetical protein
VAVIPAYLLQHTATIEPYEGSGASGPVYGTPVAVRCYREDKRRKVRAANGATVIAETTLWCPLDTVAPAGSRVDLGDRTSDVIVSARYDGGSLPVPSHVEVSCT